jgi:hypothetical protein
VTSHPSHSSHPSNLAICVLLSLFFARGIHIHLHNESTIVPFFPDRLGSRWKKKSRTS